MNLRNPHHAASLQYFGKYRGFEIFQMMGVYVIPQWKNIYWAQIGILKDHIDKILIN